MKTTKKAPEMIGAAKNYQRTVKRSRKSQLSDDVQAAADAFWNRRRIYALSRLYGN